MLLIARMLIIAGGVAEAGLKTAALVDLRHRPSAQVRGPKWLWAAVVVVVNFFGGAPLCYFAFGRRRLHPGRETALGRT